MKSQHLVLCYLCKLKVHSLQKRFSTLRCDSKLFIQYACHLSRNRDAASDNAVSLNLHSSIESK